MIKSTGSFAHPFHTHTSFGRVKWVVVFTRYPVPSVCSL